MALIDAAQAPRTAPAAAPRAAPAAPAAAEGAETATQAALAAGAAEHAEALRAGERERADEAEVREFLDKIYGLIYGGGTPDGQAAPEPVNMLRFDQSDPDAAVNALAAAAAALGAKVASDAGRAGAPLEGATAYAGTMEAVGELAEVSAREGIYDYSQEEVNSAGLRAAEQLYGLTRDSGLWERGEAERELEGLVGMDADGTLDGMARDLAAEQGMAPPGTQAAPQTGAAPGA